MAKLYKQSYVKHGRRVRVYEPRAGANFMVAFRKDGKYHPKTLGHRNPEQAEDDAYALIDALLAPTQVEEDPAHLTLRGLARHYLASEAFRSLKPRQQKEKAALLEKIVAYLGPTKLVVSVDDDAVKGLLRARKAGTHGFRKAGKQGAYNCFACLRSVVLWATQKKDDHGRKMLRENPLLGMAKRLHIRPNSSPHQPIISHETYRVLQRAARTLPMYVRVFLMLAEGTGRRASAIRGLRWDDVDFTAGKILWRGETDKMGHEMQRAIHRNIIRYLRVWQTHCPSSTCVFPAPEDASHPVSKPTVDKWPSQLYVAAGLEKPSGAGWHSFRRKWATERKGRAIPDLMQAGGWASAEALMRYLKTDDATITEVICEPTRRI